MSRNRVPYPHSWSLGTWPEEIWPHSTHKARYVVRTHRNELTAAGALTRVGRELVILGEQWHAWLEAQRGNLDGWEPIAANRARMAAAAPDASTTT